MEEEKQNIEDRFKKEAISVIKYILIGLILSITINIALAHALNTEKPIMAVVSNSMLPTFSRGDLIIVKGVDTQKIKIGDVIVYYNPRTRMPIVHRVVDIWEMEDGRRFITKGDNNAHTDQESGIAPPVHESWVKGKVVVVIPKLGYFRVAVLEVGNAVKKIF